MDLASKRGLMGLSMKGNGSMDRLMAEASFGMQTAISMMAIGKTIKLVVMDSTTTLMGLSLKVIGRMICRMVSELRFKLMEASMRAALRKE